MAGKEREIFEPKKGELSYDIDFDIESYREQKAGKGIWKDRESLSAFTRRNLETHLGERLNVLLSKTRFEIIDNQFYIQNSNEPFSAMLIKGRDYRKEHGNPSDWPREQAEVEGFSIIEKTLCDKDAKVGTMMLSVSPPGAKNSIYQHNFYDVFTLMEDDAGRFIQARRYSSSLTCREYADEIRKAIPNSPVILFPSDAYFLSHPVEVDTKLNLLADDIHRLFHRKHGFMSEDDFEKVLLSCGSFIETYVKILEDDPDNEEYLKLAFNAILNKADYVAENIKQDDMDANKNILYWGNKTVKQLATGCGISSGFSTLSKNKSPFSVRKFGAVDRDYSFDSIGECKVCGKEKVAVGPCGICEACDDRITSEQAYEVAA